MAAVRLAIEMKFNEHTIISLVEIKQNEQHLKEYQFVLVSDEDNFDFINEEERILLFFFSWQSFRLYKIIASISFDCDKFC